MKKIIGVLFVLAIAVAIYIFGCEAIDKATAIQPYTEYPLSIQTFENTVQNW